MAEKDIQKNIKDWLEDRKYVVIRIHPAIKGPPVGTSDLLCCIEGVFCALEVKDPKKIPSKRQPTRMQLRFIKKVIDAGGRGAVVHGVEEVEQIVREITGEV